MQESLMLYFDVFKNFSSPKGERKISTIEVMSISWSLHLIYAFYSVFALFLGVKSYEYISGSEDFTHLVFSTLNIQIQKITLLSTLFSVILYPFIFQFGYRFWRALFKFYAQLFDREDAEFEDKADAILASAFSCNLFLIFPIVGKFLSHLAHGFFLYKGMVSKYNFSSLQAILVLLTPIFLVFLALVFTASYFMFLLTLI
jgi:hypothetical protein